MTTPWIADGRDEGECEHDAAELREHTGCGVNCRARSALGVHAEQGVADEGADDRADDGGEQRESRRVRERVQHDGVGEGRQVRPGEGAVLREEARTDRQDRRHRQEEHDVGGEGDEPEPREGRSGPPGPRVRRGTRRRWRGADAAAPAPVAERVVTGPPKPTSRRAACRRSSTAPRSGTTVSSGASGSAAARVGIDRAGVGHGLHAHRTGAALQPEVLHPRRW